MEVGQAKVVDTDERFAFGENWRRFADTLDDSRMEAARASLAEMLGVESLAGRTFLDIGSGSGLFSLAAAQLGAERVESFDYDADSVATTRSLRDQLVPDAPWGVGQGSVLDRDFMDALGQWDVVYSWGVLHHTGHLWEAMENACARVAPGGKLFISIYNEQGPMTKIWKRVKLVYNRLPKRLRTPFVVLVSLPAELRSLVICTLKGNPGAYVRRWADQQERGMNTWRDMVDWVGGYPFETAKPEEIFDFCTARGFTLEKLTTRGGGHGCNEYVFTRGDA